MRTFFVESDAKTGLLVLTYLQENPDTQHVQGSVTAEYPDQATTWQNMPIIRDAMSRCLTQLLKANQVS